jgi:predicted Zn finger-like uncharacterized protein
MKIVCDACQAKYSISDDKVQGKVFKIRCKKCSNIIVVRGGAGAAEPVAPPTQEKETRVYDYGYEGGDQPPAGDESVWHVVINQDQVGPMTAAEVQHRFASGEIDGETYAWREGFADWLPLSQVDTFAAFVASGSTTAAVTGVASGASAVAAMFSGGGEEMGTSRSDPGDLFATASASSHTSEDDGGDLFGSKPAAKSQAAAEAANAKLRGERNENSVLFSLNNLAQLASDKPVSATPAASTAAGGSGHATGAAGGEGSGLIDIRSMANAYLGGGGGASKPATSSAIGSIDDLPVFGGGGFSEPAVIVPSARAQNNSKLMYALIGSVAALAIAAVILVIVLMKDDKKPPAVAASDDTKSETKEPDKGSAEEPKPPDPTPGSAAVADPGTGKVDPNAGKTAEPPAKDPTPGKADPPPKKDKKPKGTAAVKPDRPRDPPPPPRDTGGGGCDEVSCVLNNYEGSCCAKYKKGGSKPPSGGSPAPSKSDLPDALDRAMISEGVAKVKARIQTCGDKSSAKGTVNVSVKVSASGGVTSVTVNSSPDGSLGSCVAGAMQRATFKKTQNGGSFRYPAVF